MGPSSPGHNVVLMAWREAKAGTTASFMGLPSSVMILSTSRTIVGVTCRLALSAIDNSLSPNRSSTEA